MLNSFPKLIVTVPIWNWTIEFLSIRGNFIFPFGFGDLDLD